MIDTILRFLIIGMLILDVPRLSEKGLDGFLFFDV